MLKLYFHPRHRHRAVTLAGDGDGVPCDVVHADRDAPAVHRALRRRLGAGRSARLLERDTRWARYKTLALYKVRPLLATLPGVSAPPPSGGKVRMIVAYVDPDRLRSYGLSDRRSRNGNRQGNLTLPAGNVRVGDCTTIAATNAMVGRPKSSRTLPLRPGPAPTVFLRDVARVEDSGDVVSNVALVNGRDTVYMPLTKRPDSSTLDVVARIKNALPRDARAVPDDVHVDFEFDQSVYVKNAIRGLVARGGPRGGPDGAHGALVSAQLALGLHRRRHDPTLDRIGAHRAVVSPGRRSTS